MEGEIIKEEVEKEKKKLGIFSKIIIVILSIVLLGLIFYIRFFNTDYFTEPIEIIMIIGGVLITIVIIGLINWFKKYIKQEKEELTEEEFEKKKKTIRFYWILFLSFCCSAFVYLSVFNTLINEYSYINSIAFFAFAWGITFMFFEFFELMSSNIFNKLFHLPYYLIVKLFIPMTLLIPMFLGAIHGKYNYPSTFLSDVQISFSEFGLIGEPFYKVIKVLYNLGESRPIFIIFLCIATLLFLIWYSITTTFKPDIDSIVKGHYWDIVGVETEKEEEKSNVYRNI